MTISVEKCGRRYYLRGNTYSIKDQLRAAGAKWDADRKAWYTGKKDLAEQFAGQSSDEAAPASEPRNQAPGADATVAGRAKYKGKVYHIAGRVDRGRTSWDDSVSAITSRDGSRIMLYFRDGSRSFWVDRSAVSIVKSYRKPTTIAKLQRFAEEARSAGSAEAAIEARASRSGRCRGCGGPIKDAPHHAAMGGYCGSCAFDEYDM